MNIPRWKKLAAIGIIATLSVGMGILSGFVLGTQRDEIIERENLGGILTQIEKEDIDVRTLANVLREPPPLLPIFIASFAGSAITVWLYHGILGFLCRSRNQENAPNSNHRREGDPPLRNHKPRRNES